jgi:hypothetical protein
MPGSLPVDELQTFEEAWRDPYRGGSWCEGPWGLIRSLFRVSMNDSSGKLVVSGRYVNIYLVGVAPPFS